MAGAKASPLFLESDHFTIMLCGVKKNLKEFFI